MPSGSWIHSSVKPQGSVADDGDFGRGQPGVLGMNIPYLDSGHHRVSGRADRMPGDLEQSRAEEEHHPGSAGGPNSR
jgi:hypothetical protein